MSKSVTLAGTVFAGMVALSGDYAIGSDDHDNRDQREARHLMESGTILPLEAIVAKVRSERPGRILEVELEREDDRLIYEIELLDEGGFVWDIELDAVSGELLKTQKED